jgi:hypothetical protein
MKLEYVLHNIAYFLGLEKTYHKQALYRLFDVCNKRYFDGKLPKIKILVNNDLGNILGQTYTMIHIGEANFEPMHIYINLKGIAGNEYKMLNVMVHEMVHLWEYCFGGTLSENWVNAYRIWLTELRGIDFSNKKYEYEMIWNKIRNVLCHGYGSIHSEIFMQKCHELNENFSELDLRVAFDKPKL